MTKTFCDWCEAHIAEGRTIFVSLGILRGGGSGHFCCVDHATQWTEKAVRDAFSPPRSAG